MLYKLQAQRSLRHVAAAVLYAVGYGLFRAVSFSHWMPIAGFRLVVLLLMPYRYWPALVLGEIVPLGYVAAECVDQFGLAWAALKTLPSSLLAYSGDRDQGFRRIVIADSGRS